MSAASSSSLLPSPAVRTMKPPGIPACVDLQNALQAQALFVAGDFARDAGVLERRHVDDESPRQRDVRSDARALLAQRLLGDLDDDLLAFLEQFGNGRHAAVFRRRATERDVSALEMAWLGARPRRGASPRRPASGLVSANAAAAHFAAHAARHAMHIAAALFAKLRGLRLALGTAQLPERRFRMTSSDAGADSSGFEAADSAAASAACCKSSASSASSISASRLGSSRDVGGSGSVAEAGSSSKAVDSSDEAVSSMSASAWAALTSTALGSAEPSLSCRLRISSSSASSKGSMAAWRYLASDSPGRTAKSADSPAAASRVDSGRASGASFLRSGGFAWNAERGKHRKRISNRGIRARGSCGGANGGRVDRVRRLRRNVAGLRRARAARCLRTLLRRVQRAAAASGGRRFGGRAAAAIRRAALAGHRYAVEILVSSKKSET